jgi:hypothetical protein
MSVDVQFFFGQREDKELIMPPFEAHGQLVVARQTEADRLGPIVARIDGYYTLNSMEQRIVRENVVALCYEMYQQRRIQS